MSRRRTGGRWTSVKVAAWMAQELGLEKLAPQRGWEALKAIGWSIQKPRPRNPQAASEVEQEAFKKSRRGRRRRSASPSGPSRRSLCDGRAPIRPEAGRPLDLGAGRRSPYRSRPSPFRMALCYCICLAHHRRRLLVHLQRRLQAVLRSLVGDFRRRIPSRSRPHHFSFSTTPVGMARATSTFPTESAFSSCPPTRLNSNPQSIYGKPSMNRSSTSTSPISKLSTTSSPSVQLANDRQFIKGRAGFHWWPKITRPS